MLEGHNYWDYFRRGETMKRPELLENANKITIAFGYGSGKSQARMQVVYPIPLSELEANKAIRDPSRTRVTKPMTRYTRPITNKRK